MRVYLPTVSLTGKLTVDRLGFVSDKHSCELRACDIRFRTNPPEEVGGRAEQRFLRLAENVELDGSPGGETRCRRTVL